MTNPVDEGARRKDHAERQRRTRNDRETRSGQSFSVYFHFEEKDAVDAAAEARNVRPNAIIRAAIRSYLGLPVAHGE